MSGEATGSRDLTRLTSDLPQDAPVLARIDRSLLALRQVLVRPVTSELPIPSLGRSVEFAKVVACEAVAGLEDRGTLPTVKALAASLHLDHSTMSRVLSDGEADGLLTRGQDPADRRRTVIGLTDDGRTLVRDGLALRVWFMGQVLAQWAPDDVEALASHLERAVLTFEERFPLALAEAEEALGPLFPPVTDAESDG